MSAPDLAVDRGEKAPGRNDLRRRTARARIIPVTEFKVSGSALQALQPDWSYDAARSPKAAPRRAAPLDIKETFANAAINGGQGAVYAGHADQAA